jgi:hypothetical protein
VCPNKKRWPKKVLHDSLQCAPPQKKGPKKASKKSFKCAQRKKKWPKKSFKEVPQAYPRKKEGTKKKFQRSPSSVPKEKRSDENKVSKKSLKCAQTKIKVKKSYKAVPQMCPNTNKSQKKLQSSPSNVPKQEKEVPRKKKFKSHFTPYYQVWSLVSGFHPQLWGLYGIQKQGMKQIEGMEQGMGLEGLSGKQGFV